MALLPCTDPAVASWIVADDRPWDALVTLGPGGFPAYARLRSIPDPVHVGQSENDVVRDAGTPSDAEGLRAVLDTLGRHTRTPDEVYVAFWDCWPWHLHGDDAAGPPDPTGRPGDARAGAALLRSALRSPVLVLPHRAYHLVRGALADLGPGGSVDLGPGRRRVRMPEPAFVWPADRAWCVTDDVDPHWAGIGAGTAAVDELVGDPHLDVVRVGADESPPRYR